MTDTRLASSLLHSTKQRIFERWNDSQSRFYIVFSVCLGLMNLILAGMTSDPDIQQNTFFLGVVIFVLVALFAMGLPLNWTLNICIAYAFFHMVREAIMTGGMFSNTLNWLAMVPIIPLFLISVSSGVFWLIVC